MKRTWICLLLAAALMLAGFCTRAESAADGNGLPQVGDKVCGFTVVNAERFELVGADLIVYEHDKTGAIVMYIANGDTNRTFEITFRTPALDNSGMPHVFEHSTLDGSEKYPSKSLFFNLSYQTYNTYMNAATYNFMTTYPVASLSEEQLLAYADYYTDSCFNPMLMTDDSIIKEEAWRYSMTSADAPLTLVGTVYSEMGGSYTIASAADFNFYGTIMPGSYTANVHGGKPENIPELTADALRAYHDTYYHPSNSLTCLYGKFEHVEAFLELLDGCFSAYDRAEIDLSHKNYAPITESVTASFAFPWEATANVANNSYIYYGFVCEGAGTEDCHKLDMLTTLLGDNTSPVIQALKAALPGGSFAVYYSFDGPEVCVIFEAEGLNPEDAQTFRQTVDEALNKLSQTGFDAQAVDGIISAFRLSTMLYTESSAIGIDLIPNIAYYWAGMGDLYGFMNYISELDRFSDYAEDGTLMEMLNTYLLNNPRTALVTTYPQPGLKEEQDAALADKLADIKAAMTEDEIAAIVEATNAQEAADDASAYVAQLQTVTVESLPEEMRIYNITEKTGANGEREIFSEAEVDNVGTTLVMLDATSLPQEYLHFFKLYTDILGELDTAAHSREELAARINRYLYDGVIKVSIFDEDSDYGFHTYVRCGFTALDEDVEEGYDLLYELLFESDVTNVDRLLEQVSTLESRCKRDIMSACYQAQLYRAIGNDDITSRIYAYNNYIEYYQFLKEVHAALEEQPEVVVDALKSVQASLNNRTGIILGFAGSAESAQNNWPLAEAFAARLNEKPIERQTYVFEDAPETEGIVMDSVVQYNLVYASFEDLGLTEYTADMDVLSSLVSDQILYPVLRDKYGAYGVLHGAFENAGLYVVSYRDPNVRETFDVYEALPDSFLAMCETLDQETLDNYIISTYSYYAQSTGELSGAFNAILNSYLNGRPQEEVLEYMRQLKGVDVDTIRAYAPAYAALWEKGMKSTVGGQAVIDENADLYESILTPFTAETVEGVEADAWYASYVSSCMDYGLMAPMADGSFHPEEPATIGDMATGFAAMVGFGVEGQAAVDTLAEYGIMEGNASDTLDRDSAVLFTFCFNYAIGMEPEESELPGEFADADSVSEDMLGVYGWMLNSGLLLPAQDGLLAPEAPLTRAELALILYTVAFS